MKNTVHILPRRSESTAEHAGLCASSQPLRRVRFGDRATLDDSRRRLAGARPGPVTAEAPDLLARLDALAERVREARAAAETIADGDPSAMTELDAEVDAMAADVAALKGMTGQTLG